MLSVEVKKKGQKREETMDHSRTTLWKETNYTIYLLEHETPKNYRRYELTWQLVKTALVVARSFAKCVGRGKEEPRTRAE